MIACICAVTRLGCSRKRRGDYIEQELKEWAELGVEGHFHAKNPWMPYHRLLTEQTAELVGAKPLEVVVMNSLTVNLHLMMVSFYRPTKGRGTKLLWSAELSLRSIRREIADSFPWVRSRDFVDRVDSAAGRVLPSR